MKPLMLAIALFLFTQTITVNGHSASEETLKQKSFTIIHKLQTRLFCKNLREEIIALRLLGRRDRNIYKQCRTS